MSGQPVITQPLTASTRAAQLLGIIGAVAFAPAAVYSLLSGNIAYALLFLALAFGSGFITFSALGNIQMDAEAISLRYRNRLDSIRWDEVTFIEKAGDTLIFNGPEKCLVVIEPMWWQGRDKANMLTLLADQIRQRELPVRSNLLATLRRSRNVRVA